MPAGAGAVALAGAAGLLGAADVTVAAGLLGTAGLLGAAAGAFEAGATVAVAAAGLLGAAGALGGALGGAAPGVPFNCPQVGGGAGIVALLSIAASPALEMPWIAAAVLAGAESVDVAGAAALFVAAGLPLATCCAVPGHLTGDGCGSAFTAVGKGGSALTTCM